MMDAALRQGAQALGLVLSEGQITQLLDFLALLQKWNKVYNLTAVRDPQEMLTHHLLDSLAAVAPLRRPGVEYGALMGLNEGRYASAEVSAQALGELSESVIEQVEIAAKYSGYIDRQKEEVQRAAHYETLRLPAELDYMQVAALSFEVRQKLQKHRPETLGQASRISGVTPAAISLLMVHLKKGGFKGFATQNEEASA